jgi:hypothetical protein
MSVRNMRTMRRSHKGDDAGRISAVVAPSLSTEWCGKHCARVCYVYYSCAAGLGSAILRSYRTNTEFIEDRGDAAPVYEGTSAETHGHLQIAGYMPGIVSPVDSTEAYRLGIRMISRSRDSLSLVAPGTNRMACPTNTMRITP